MKSHIPAFLAAAVFLAGCTDQDWSHALTYVGVHNSERDMPEARPVPAAARPAPAQSAPVQAADAAPHLNAFCQAVAMQDSQRNDFDPPTQQRVLIQSYRQCVTIFGDATQ